MVNNLYIMWRFYTLSAAKLFSRVPKVVLLWHHCCMWKMCASMMIRVNWKSSVMTPLSWPAASAWPFQGPLSASWPFPGHRQRPRLPFFFWLPNISFLFFAARASCQIALISLLMTVPVIMQLPFLSVMCHRIPLCRYWTPCTTRWHLPWGEMRDR